MNNEIKEILDTLQECVDNPINEFYYPEKVYNRVHMNPAGCKVLLDYITNLQQENERLKGTISAMKHNYKLLTTLIENGESMTQKFVNGLNCRSDE